MNAYQLENGNLLIPKRAEAESLLGDGMTEVSPGDPDYAAWMDYYHRRGEEPPPVPEQGNA